MARQLYFMYETKVRDINREWILGRCLSAILKSVDEYGIRDGISIKFLAYFLTR